jgi:hypothetical protein
MDWALAYRPCDLPGGRGRSVGQPVLRSQFAEFGQLVASGPGQGAPTSAANLGASMATGIGALA